MATPITDYHRAAANLAEAHVFAAECDETVEEWFKNPDVIDDPEWQEAFALHLELTNDNG